MPRGHMEERGGRSVDAVRCAAVSPRMNRIASSVQDLQGQALLQSLVGHPIYPFTPHPGPSPSPDHGMPPAPPTPQQPTASSPQPPPGAAVQRRAPARSVTRHRRSCVTYDHEAAPSGGPSILRVGNRFHTFLQSLHPVLKAGAARVCQWRATVSTMADSAPLGHLRTAQQLHRRTLPYRCT